MREKLCLTNTNNIPSSINNWTNKLVQLVIHISYYCIKVDPLRLVATMRLFLKLKFLVQNHGYKRANDSAAVLLFHPIL